MNSKQRRKDRRQWKYTVNTIAKDYDHYIEMWNWLANAYGRKILSCGWRVKFELHTIYEYDESLPMQWIFDNQHKASNFAMRWA